MGMAGVAGKAFKEGAKKGLSKADGEFEREMTARMLHVKPMRVSRIAEGIRAWK